MKIVSKITVVPITISGEIKDGSTTILKYKIVYPQFISKEHNAQLRKINYFYKKKALAYEKYIKTKFKSMAVSDYKNSVANGYPIHEYEAYSEYTLTYNRSCAISLYSDQYEYTGGAHGNTVRTAQTWDLNNGKLIPLSDYFPSNAKINEHLKTLIKAKISNAVASGDKSYFDNYADLVDKTFDPKNYYLTNDALVIYFQVYDIAPHSSGIVTFEFPYKVINAQLPYCKS